VRENEVKKISIGTSDFKQLRDEDLYYVDKSLFIKEILADTSRVVLLPRPRRFGKTLNMTMLRYFLEKALEAQKENFPNNSYLFKGLAIEQEEEIMKYQSKYPVIYLTFKGVKQNNFKNALESIKRLLSNEYARHSYLLKDKKLTETAAREYKQIIKKEGNIIAYEESIKNLTAYLEKYYKEKVVVIIDEYDTPVHEAYVNGYYEEMISFMRSFLGAGLKDNSSLKKGVLTGIMLIAKESIFSDINNLGVYTLLKSEHNQSFGFTEAEVSKILKDYELIEKEDTVKTWYNGYIFGGQVIYNPWSILNYVNSNDKLLEPYWINTSSNDVIKKYLASSTQEVKEKLERLIKGESLKEVVMENVAFKDIENHGELLWSFLLFSGYLKAEDRLLENRKIYYKLSIPNEEVKHIYEQIIATWFEKTLSNVKANQMLQAMLEGKEETFEELLNEFVINIMSYYNLGEEAERVYQAFVLGMLVNLQGEYEVRSELESGYGRAEVLVIPQDKSKNGVVLEFKKQGRKRPKAVEVLLKEALEQIEEKRYEEALKANGVNKVIKIVGHYHFAARCQAK